MAVGRWSQRREHEDLDRQIGVDVVVAHEADHLASGELLDLAADVGFHDALPASAQIEDSQALAGVRQRLLAAREAVLEHDEDTVLAERGSRLRRTAAGRARERSDDGLRDRFGELSLLASAVG